jgi:hypothetical protein
MRKIIKLLFLSCSIIATHGYAVPSSEDDGSSLKRAIAKQNQPTKRIRKKDDRKIYVGPPSRQEKQSFYFLSLIPLKYQGFPLKAEDQQAKDQDYFSRVMQAIGSLDAKSQKELARVDKNHLRLVIESRMANDPRKLHLNPWVLLPDLGQVDLYRLNAAVSHGAKGLMQAHVSIEMDGEEMEEDEKAYFIKPVHDAWEFISITFGENGVLGSISRFFQDAEQQIVEDGICNHNLDFPEQIADSATSENKSEFNLECLYRYITDDARGAEDFKNYRDAWLTIDPEEDPHRMSLPKRNALVYDLQKKMRNARKYTPVQRGEFARAVSEFMLCDASNIEMKDLIEVFVESGQYTLAASHMNRLIEGNGGPEIQQYYTISEWANMNLYVGNYEKVAQIYDDKINQGDANQLGLGDFNMLIMAYKALGKDDKVMETKDIARACFAGEL